ncbi:MAG: CBS domain-containing protein [Anaerolineae bacterium]
MATVRDMLKTKGPDIWSVTPDTSVYDALKLMADKNVGAVLVMDGDNIKGILSERDYARKIALQGKTSANTPAGEIMTTRVFCVGPGETAEQVMALMTEKRIRHLPVLENDRLIGIISIGDVVKATIAQKEFIIEQLEEYVRGTPYLPPQATKSA